VLSAPNRAMEEMTSGPPAAPPEQMNTAVLIVVRAQQTVFTARRRLTYGPPSLDTVTAL
jgi:hypothetical protein